MTASRSRALYTAALTAATPLIAGYLLARSRRQPAYRAHWAERWALYRGGPENNDERRAPAPGAPTIWLHAVSLGETRAAAPLVAALRETWPAARLLVTQMTPTGRDAAQQLFGESAEIAYLPYDYPYAVRRFYDRFAPSLGILMETELWPNLLAQAQARELPVALVNARMSPRSFARAQRFAGLARETLGALALVAAQTDEDARRLTVLGARSPVVTGNLKFDLQPPDALIARGRAWRAGFARERVLLAASTREGEEALLFDALRRQPDARRLTVLVPRHPQRFDEVERDARQAGLHVTRRSVTQQPSAEVDVWLGDSMGELPAYYAAADVAFVGGSLLPHGGQNLIEACACGAPVLLGRHTFNFAQAAEQAVEAGAARRIDSADALLQAANDWLNDPASRGAASQAGLRFAAMHRGATQRTVALLAALLKEP